MVHLDLALSNDNVLRAIADLAQRFESSVIGIAACQPMQITYAGGVMVGELLEHDQAEIEREMSEAETSIRAAMANLGSNIE